MEFSLLLIWNLVVTLILGPIWFSIRKNEKEIAINKTEIFTSRIEMGKLYVTKKDLAEDVSRILDQLRSVTSSINRLDAKVDSLLLDK
tara:strand:- start:3517 stop:3780 length:264 start_codon:yes stop_codon:yes gene_type:complete